MSLIVLLELEEPAGLSKKLLLCLSYCRDAAKGHMANTVCLHHFTGSPSQKTFIFVKLWRTTYPIHKGHCPCISAQHWNITAFLPSVWPAVFVQFSSCGGLYVCHPYLLWPGQCLQANLYGNLCLTSTVNILERPVVLVRTLDPQSSS